VSNVSFAWERRNGVPTGKIFANAFSFTGEIRVQIQIPGLYALSGPSHNAMTAMSTPD